MAFAVADDTSVVTEQLPVVAEKSPVVAGQASSSGGYQGPTDIRQSVVAEPMHEPGPLQDDQISFSNHAATSPSIEIRT